MSESILKKKSYGEWRNARNGAKAVMRLRVPDEFKELVDEMASVEKINDASKYVRTLIVRRLEQINRTTDNGSFIPLADNESQPDTDEPQDAPSITPRQKRPASQVGWLCEYCGAVWAPGVRGCPNHGPEKKK